MKKSTLLSLLTAGAVIATSAGTFAAWDQTTATASSNVTINTRVKTEVATNLSFTAPTELNTTDGTTSDYTGTAVINVENIPEAKKADYKLDVSEVSVYATAEDGTTKAALVDAAAYTAVATDGKTDLATDVNGTHPITVNLKINDNEKGHALAGENLIVEVNAEVKANTAS